MKFLGIRQYHRSDSGLTDQMRGSCFRAEDSRRSSIGSSKAAVTNAEVRFGLLDTSARRFVPETHSMSSLPLSRGRKSSPWSRKKPLIANSPEDEKSSRSLDGK